MAVKNDKTSSSDKDQNVESTTPDRGDEVSPEQRLAETDRGRETGDNGLGAAIENSRSGGRDDS
jgi:hypothetical protein